MRPESRKWERFPQNLIVYYRAITNIETAMLPSNSQAETKNVSRAGIGLVLDEYVAPGTVLKMDMALPQKSRMIVAYCRVIWINYSELTKKYDSGMEIEEMSEEDQTDFYEFLSMLNK